MTKAVQSSPAFDSAYAALNSEQKRTVDAIEGPVFVIAGPGTGKTQVLTLRIANILRTTDTPPDGILALTFTDSAVRTLRERLVGLIGERGYKVRIHTFHSFAQYVVNTYPDYFPRIIGSEIATDAERAEMLEKALLSTPVTHLRPLGDSLYYHSHVSRAISILKKENTSPEDLAKRTAATLTDFDADPEKFHQKGKYEGQMKGAFVAKKKRLEKTADLAAVYAAYEEGLRAIKRYDYDDLILEVLHALEQNNELLLQVQESMLYVLADEHQDANASQNALLELVSGFHDHPNLFIVGDEKQAIYRFQGADLDNVHYFRNKFSDAQIITLVENYRSTQPILDSALSLVVSSPDERLSRVPLIASAPHAVAGSQPASLQLSICPDVDTEFALLAERIQQALAEGTAGEDIAILVRRNVDVEVVERALTRLGVAVSGGGDADVFGNRFARALLRVLRAVAEPSDSNVAHALALPGFGITTADLQRVITSAKIEQVPLLDFIQNEGAIRGVGVSNPATVQQAGAHLAMLASRAAVERPAVIAEAALARSGLMALALAAPDRNSSLGALRALLNALEDMSRREHDALLPRALETLDRLEARGVRLASQADEPAGAARLMTVHRAKGREFRRVFIPRLSSRAWSTKGKATHFELPGVLSGSVELEDERRLLYVAITRAKESAVMSYARIGEDGRDADPSELIAEISPALLTVREEAAVEHALLESTNDIFRTEPNEQDREALRTAFFARGLSATALNNYLACPWKYFYVNLLRIPDIEDSRRLYGTSIHATLAWYADRRAVGEKPDVEALIAHYEHSLTRSPLPEHTISDLRAEGKTTLTAWWNEKHGGWPEQATAEEPITANITLGTGDTDRVGADNQLLRLTGSLDLVVRTADGLIVTDYKTGRYRSANELKGETKDATGDYYRQLAFYKLMLARKDSPEHMRTGIIEFVSPDEKGRIRSHEFSIADAEINELESTIKRVAHEILKLSFWHTPCDETNCTWCEYRFGLER